MKKILTALLGMLLFAGLNQAQATTYTFSDVSSDATPASVLDATLSFVVTAGGADGGDDLLTITLDNQTTAPNTFSLDELYFNFTGNSALLGFDSTNGGLGGLSSTPASADGFGTFDVNIIGYGLASGATEVWQIDLGVTGISMSDFDLLSTIPPGMTQAFAALKFKQGPDDPEAPGFEDSAFGAVTPVPVPGAVILFGSGLLGLLGISRRKKVT